MSTESSERTRGSMTAIGRVASVSLVVFAVLGARAGAIGNPITPASQRGSTPAAALVAATGEAPMLAVARLLTEEKWKPVLDRIIQGAPAAAPLGLRWAPANAPWQKARTSLGARVTKVLDAYPQSGDLVATLEA